MSRKTTPRPAARLGVEAFEDRTVPATFTIPNGDVPMLIAAITAANTNNEADTINLAAGGTYTLTAVDNMGPGGGTNGLPIIALDTMNAANSVTINGNGATIQRSTAVGTPQFRLLAIDQANTNVNGVNFLNGTAVAGGFAGIGDGGAILVQGLAPPTVTINQCFFSGNSASFWGGAVAINSGNATVSNSTFDGNTTVGNFNGGGGGLSVFGSNQVSVVNCTFTNNTTTTGQGGGVSASFTGATNLSLQNTIVFGNTAPSNPTNADLWRGGGSINADFCIIGVPGTAFLGGPAVNGSAISTQFGVDPLLGNLQNNGGTTLTRLPAANGPAFNGGNNATAVGPFDQRGTGFPRITGAAVDIGAAELQSVPVTPPTTPPVTPPAVPPAVPPTIGGITPGTTTTATTTGVVLTTTVDATGTVTVVATNPDGSTITSIQAPPGSKPVVGGAGAGGLPVVTVLNPRTGAVVRSFLAYAPEFKGGVNVAAGDVTGDGVPDIVTAPASDGGPDVHVFDGASGNLIANFFAYPQGFTGGVNVAVGDVNGDGRPDIITGAGEGGGPHVRAFNGSGFGSIRDFLAYGRGYTGGVTVGSADFNGDGTADIVTGTQTGGNHVRVFSGANNSSLFNLLVGANTEVGVSVAAGDVTGDGQADVIVGQGSGGSLVGTFDGRNMALLNVTSAYPRFDGGLSVDTVDQTGDGLAEIITGAGVGGGPHIRVLNGTTLDPVLDLLAIGDGSGGVNV